MFKGPKNDFHLKYFNLKIFEIINNKVFTHQKADH